MIRAAAAAGAVALALALAGCSQTPPPPAHWTLVHRVNVGRTPGPVTLGGQWAFVPNMSDGTVTQIERASGKVVATITVADPQVLRAQGCAPDSVHAYYSGSWGWRSCDTPFAIGWDGASLWALDNGDRQLVRVDAASHHAEERVQLPGIGWSLAFGGGKAWVSGWSDHSLYVVDTASRTLAASITDIDSGPATLVDGAGAVWIVCARGVNGVGHLDRVDTTSLKVTNRYDIEWFSTAVTAVGDSVFVRGSYGGDISRIDAATGVVTWSQPGPGFIGRQGIDEIAATPTGVWMSGPTTARVDLATGAIAERIFVVSSSVAAADGELWVQRIDGSIVEYRFQ